MTQASDLRTNIATWAVTTQDLGALGYALPQLYPTESYDPVFRGQYLETTYFDSRKHDLARARKRADRYLTLRIRCYAPSYTPGSPRQYNAETYAISAKTDEEKWRADLPAGDAEVLLSGSHLPNIQGFLPSRLLARCLELLDNRQLLPVVTICSHRYAVEDKTSRITLDVNVHTDTGKHLPYHVLEFKSTDPNACPEPALCTFGLRPIKLSKFLWAMES